MVRACMIDALGRDFISTARAKGVPERTIVFKHGLRNALLPIITFFGLGLGHLLGGAAVTESIFNWPGLGRLMVDSILTRDLPSDPGLPLLLRHDVHPGQPRGRPPVSLGGSED